MKELMQNIIAAIALAAIIVGVVLFVRNVDTVGEYLVKSISTHTTTQLWKL